MTEFSPLSANMSVTTRIDDREAQRQFNRLKGTLRKKVLTRAMRKGAIRARDEMRRRAPRGRTGKLARNIHIKSVKAYRNVVSMDIAPTREVYYGLMQELGWTDLSGTHHPARPFLRPSLDEKKGEIIKKVKNEIKLEIIKVTK